MNHKTLGFVTLGGLVCLAVVMSMATASVAGLDGKISSLLTQQLALKGDVMVLSEDVDRGEGRVTTVTTTKQDNETLAEFIARHDAAVALLKKD